MGIKSSSKINKLRTIALALVFAGMVMMYIGLFFQTNQVILILIMGIGFFSIIASSCLYFWIGMLSTRTHKVQCPTCGKYTKILGRVDVCMYCDQPLTTDRSLEGKEFNRKYNRKK